YTPLPTSSFLLPSSIPSSSGSESIPEIDIPLQKRARFTTPTSRYKIGESSVAAAARQIRPTLTIAESHGGFTEGGQYPTKAEYRARSKGSCTQRWR
nr:hypothetical protein [Tanacetum cinerariifolium]